MIVQYDPSFIDKLKAVDVRTRKSFAQKIELFCKDPYNLALNNHELHDEYDGLRSIDITNDYRALYEQVPGANEPVAYFALLGTHKELYG